MSPGRGMGARPGPNPGGTAPDATASPPLLLRVVRGAPDDAELAALVAVLAARARDRGDPGRHPPASRWADRSRALLTRPGPGPGGWTSSSLPR